MKLLHNAKAEQSLIGAVLLDPTVLDRVDLSADSAGEFYDRRHQAVWRALHALRAAGKPIGDPAMIAGELGDLAEPVGPYVYELFSATSDAAPENAAHYADEIRDHAITRRALEVIGEITASNLTGGELVAAALQRLGSLGGQERLDPSVTMAEAARETVKDVVDAQYRQDLHGGQAWGISTGFDDVDRHLGGLQRGVVTILAGRPSMGKSALARTLADNIASRKDGGGVHVFSSEDSRRAYTLRALSDRARIPLRRLRGLQLRGPDFADLERAADALADRTNWRIDDSTGLSSAQIGMRVRRHRKALKTSLVIVDYVQLLREPNARDRRLEVEAAATSLVDLARKENVALLLLSQLSRECEKRDDKRPLLSDLRESGALEQVADAVMFLYRPEVYDEKGEPELLIRKNKHGQRGVIHLAWDSDTATYRPLELRDRIEPPPPARHWQED